MQLPSWGEAIVSNADLTHFEESLDYVAMSRLAHFEESLDNVIKSQLTHFEWSLDIPVSVA